MKHETAPSPAIIAKLTNEQLLKAWETTEFLSTSPETAITRGWIMDELEKRNPSAFNAWLDSESPEDSTLQPRQADALPASPDTHSRAAPGTKAAPPHQINRIKEIITMSKSQIMRQAWSLYRATVAEFPETRSRAQFALCLKEAHRAAQAATAARREWENMSGEEQYTALIRMAWTVKHRAEATGRAADTEWIRTPDDAQTVAAEAWPRVAPALTRNEQADEPHTLTHILFAACTQSAHVISRAEYRHVSNCCQLTSTADADGDDYTQTPLDILPSVTAAPISSPEDIATTRAAIEAAAADNIDRAIIRALAAGHTVRTIAAALGMSKSAIQRRIDKIRARYLAQA